MQVLIRREEIYADIDLFRAIYAVFDIRNPRLSCNFSFTQNFISSRPSVLCIISWKRGLDRSLLRFPLSASLLRDSLLRVVHSTIFIERDSIENKISYSCTHRFIDGNKSKMDNEERRFLEGIKFEF